MIKRLISLFSPYKLNPMLTQKVRVIPQKEHGISLDQISPNAIKVINRLTEHHFEAYLVGGAVRDLLLGSSPKDFDIATNAKPEEINALFRNSRIIGRRFKIVHVRYGREIIEVTTFRGQNSDSSHQVESDTGQLLRDNVYGDLESDAIRRDFTTNALYYSPKNESVYDFVNGSDDIDQRVLTLIGDPLTRYKEDPVRLLRAIRFAAKLGFTISPLSADPIPKNAELLQHVAPARLFEEILKLFLNGNATATYELLKDYQLIQQLFPVTYSILDKNPVYEAIIREVMLNTDKRIRNDKRVTPAFIYATFLWPAMREQQLQLSQQGLSPLEAFHQASQGVISQQLQTIMIPKRFLIPMKQIWELQWRLPNRLGKRAFKTMEHPKFRAGFDFLLVRENAGENLNGLGNWWDSFQQASDNTRTKMVFELGQQSGQKKRKRKPRSKTQGSR
jgi:poly(A) polymerase